MTVDNAYGMADLTELIERAAKKYVSTIDLASAYWQVPMSSESKSLTSFRTRRGLFQWNVMPQGLKNSSKTFQAFTNKVLWKMACMQTHIKMILSSQVTRLKSI